MAHLEKGKAIHSTILAWRIPWTVQSMGSQRVDTTERLSLYGTSQFVWGTLLEREIVGLYPKLVHWGTSSYGASPP